MSRPIVPIAQLQSRIPTAGRLRFGHKVGKKGAPKAIDTWRFTSHDAEAIEQVASIYGGQVEPWSDAPTPGQWQVTTTASELRIVLPPDPLGGSPIYEQWSGGGCQRRCDGVTCVVNQRTGPDEVEPVETPCICGTKGEMECEVKTRLSVILPDIKFAGVWRLDSGSWNVAHEMPGMVELVQSLQQRGLTRGLLALEHRKSVSGGKTRRFIVPTLRVDGSMDQLAAGQMQVGALAQVEQRPQITAGEPQTTWEAQPSYGHPNETDEAVEGVVVEPFDVDAALAQAIADARAAGVDGDFDALREWADESDENTRLALSRLNRAIAEKAVTA